MITDDAVAMRLSSALFWRSPVLDAVVCSKENIATKEGYLSGIDLGCDLCRRAQGGRRGLESANEFSLQFFPDTGERYLARACLPRFRPT